MEERDEVEAQLQRLLEDEDVALKKMRLEEIENWKELYKEEEGGRKYDKRRAKETLGEIKEKLRKTERLLSEAQAALLQAVRSTNSRRQFPPYLATASSEPCLLSNISGDTPELVWVARTGLQPSVLWRRGINPDTAMTLT